MKKTTLFLCILILMIIMTACATSDKNETNSNAFTIATVATTEPVKSYPESFIGEHKNSASTCIFEFYEDGIMTLLDIATDEILPCEWYVNSNDNKLYIFFGTSDNMGIFTYEVTDSVINIYHIDNTLYDTILLTDDAIAPTVAADESYKENIKGTWETPDGDTYTFNDYTVDIVWSDYTESKGSYEIYIDSETNKLSLSIGIEGNTQPYIYISEFTSDTELKLTNNEYDTTWIKQGNTEM